MESTMKDRIFRTRAQKYGGHYTVLVYSADGSRHSFAKIGTLVMEETDYPCFVQKFRGEHILEDTA